MGKILSGILGPVSGRVGGVVGSRWKSVPYIRSYVVPGESNTALQSAQRDRFAYVVAAGKNYVGRIMNPYYDKFLNKVSGFNRYISNNIPKAPTYTPVTLHQVTDGPLYPGSSLVVTYNAGTGALAVTWGAETGIDGANDDVAIAWARHRTLNVAFFSADGERVDAGASIAAPTGLTPSDFDCGVFFAKLTGSLVNKISRNLNVEAVAA